MVSLGRSALVKVGLGGKPRAGANGLAVDHRPVLVPTLDAGGKTGGTAREGTVLSTWDRHRPRCRSRALALVLEKGF